MRKVAALLTVFTSLTLLVPPVLGQNIVISQDYVQEPNGGYPSGSVLVKNVSPYEIDVLVRWPGMKADYPFSINPGNDANIILPANVELKVRAWAWTYDKNGKRHRREMQFLWYFDRSSERTVFWFPYFK